MLLAHVLFLNRFTLVDSSEDCICRGVTLKQNHKTLYEKVAGKLRKRVAKLAPGDILESESKLSGQFGVSVATIREAIRMLASEGRLQSQQGRGTIVLPPIAQTVALLLGVDILAPETSRFYFDATRAARHALEETGAKVRHYYGRATAETPEATCQCDEFFEDLHAGKISGVIALGAFPEPRLLKAIEDRALPSVGMYPGFKHFVRSDVEQFLRDAIGYCVAQGRKRIAVLAWNGAMDPDFCNYTQVSQVLASCGLTARPEWHRADLHPNLAGAGWESFREIWTSSREKPDAIIITDDCLFADAYQAISDLQIAVPRDLLIVAEASENGNVPRGGAIARMEVSAQETGEALVSAFVDAQANAAPVRRLLHSKLVPMALSHPIPSPMLEKSMSPRH